MVCEGTRDYRFAASHKEELQLANSHGNMQPAQRHQRHQGLGKLASDVNSSLVQEVRTKV